MSEFDRPAFCVTLDADGRVVDTYTGGGLEQLGFRPGDIVGRSVFELVDRDSDAGSRIQRALEGETLDATVTFAGHTFRAWYLPEVTEETVEQVHCLVLDVSAETHRRDLLTVLNQVLRHNLRNKLTVVIGVADELEAAYPEEDRPARIVEAGEDLLTLSGKVRRMEVFAASGPGIEPAPLDPLVDSALDEVVATLGETSVAYDGPGTPVYVPRGIEPALVELVENAIEHNTPPREVRIEARLTDGVRETVEIDIVDNGPGLSPNDRLVLEGGDEPPLSYASSIGLWLARWACESAGTEISVDPTATGTRISLRAPAQP